MRVQYPISVLLVEDNADDVRLIEEALRQPSATTFLVDRVDRLGGAIEWLRRRSPAVVLLDLNLPDSKGLETLVVLRTHVPRTPIVVLTMRPDDEGPRAIRAGAQDYLSKDQLQGEVLARALRYAIERQALVNELQRRHLQERREQERRTLGPLAAVGDTSSGPDVFGEASLREASQDLFRALVRKYADALHTAAALEVDVIPARVADRIEEIARRLGVLNAGPRDVLELHAVTLEIQEQELARPEFRALRERGQVVLLELMSALAAHYRRYTIDLREIHA